MVGRSIQYVKYLVAFYALRTPVYIWNRIARYTYFILFRSSLEILACEYSRRISGRRFSPSEKKRLRTPATKRFPWRETFLANHGLALKIKELTRETSRKIVRGGYVYKQKLKGRRSLCMAAFFSQNAFTKVNLSELCRSDWGNKHQEDSYRRKD